MSQSAERVLQALQILAEHREVGVVELSRLMALDKSTASRLLAVLSDRGFARQIEETRRYRLGPETARVGYAYVKSHDLRHEVRPALQQLSDRTGETATLAIYDRGAVVVLDRVEGVHRIRTVSEIGMRAPIHAGASCKALLAHLSYTELELILTQVHLVRLTPYTIVDPGLLKDELARIRQQGYAISDQEVELDHLGLGAPITDYRRRVVAAVSVAGPKERFRNERMQSVIREVVEAARLASALLGHPEQVAAPLPDHLL